MGKVMQFGEKLQIAVEAIIPERSQHDFFSCVIKCSLHLDLGVGSGCHKLYTMVMEDFYFC